jgi:hypothetical protein
MNPVLAYSIVMACLFFLVIALNRFVRNSMTEEEHQKDEEEIKRDIITW